VSEPTETTAADDTGTSGPTSVEELGEGRVSYDCTAWAGESRGLLTNLLGSAGVQHVWQGTTLTVRDEDEAAVDDLVDDVLAAARPALDPDAAKLVYEVGDWPVSLQTELADGLTASDIAYEWDERGDLVVREEDEEAVAAVLDELPEPDDAEISADDGVALHELLDSLFMASSRLVKHPADPSATVALVDAADVIAQVAVPFGFESAQWRRLVGEVSELRQAVEGDGEAATVEGDADISQRAIALREHLRTYV
jgi:hypothetical protein